MNCTRCLAAVSPNSGNTQHLNLNNIGVNETLNKLNCTNCQICVYLSLTDNNWENVDSSLRKKKKENGWEIVKEKDELVKVYILCQVVYNEIEGPFDESHIFFDFPDKTDLVKILWKDGNAIGFYNIKQKDSIVMETMDSYGMTTLDTAYIRSEHRKQGYGLLMLEDIVKTFPQENIGISSPISLSMYHVINKFLRLNPSYRSKLWEVSGVGSEGNRKLIYVTLKKLFNL